MVRVSCYSKIMTQNSLTKGFKCWLTSTIARHKSHQTGVRIGQKVGMKRKRKVKQLWESLQRKLYLNFHSRKNATSLYGL